MIAELGQFVLILAFMAALLQASLPMLGAVRRDGALMQTAGPAALIQFALIAAAFGALTWLHATSDFSVLNVAENSHTAKPFVYKLTGVWGNHEGSMLLWVLILAVFGAALAGWRIGAVDMLRVKALSIQGAIAAAFLAFIIFTSNPFARLFPAPQDGADLNPLLQDPGLIIHPPFLYLGYVGFSITFAYAIAGLITGKIDEAWAAAVRPWALAAWVFLTIGIALGSWWAYYELGWGGFWAWDPVENASFMPWLAGTAFLHSVRVLEKRGALKIWCALLAIMAFSLSLVGTFLVRSGILTSVHAFAVDPTRGVFILLILAAVIGGSLLLFALRAPSLTSNTAFAPVSREGGIIINNILISTACVTVFVGTFYPLFVDVISGDRISVGAPYFNTVFLPLMGVLLAVMGIAATLSWKKADLTQAVTRIWPAAAAGVALGVIAAFLTWPKFVAGSLGVALAVWAGGAAIIDLFQRSQVRTSGAAEAMKKIADLPRPYLGMTAAHIGVAIVAIGVIGAGAWRSEQFVFMKPTEQINIGGYDVTLDRIVDAEGPNFISQTAVFSVSRSERTLRTINAERRFYPVRRMQTTEAGVWTGLRGDLYLTIGESNPERGQVVRAYYNPFAVWMWIGASFMALGGVIAALPKRQPKRLVQSLAAAPAPGAAE